MRDIILIVIAFALPISAIWLMPMLINYTMNT